ncbi:hypothetical protein P3T42_000591 [Paraburkholderia sp. GAS38]|jgi:hypothetical protein|uniref:hypothetical protein n=1 Tax=Paraburkholderia sp. GAS38 TaxID=3035133 RepID=UPI003D1F3CBC
MKLIARALQNLFVISLVMLSCQACVIETTHYDDGKTETHVMGLVRLDIYRSSGGQPGLVATRLRSVGIRFGGESGIGYFDDSEISVPLDCRLVFLVQTDAQLVAAGKIVNDGLDGRGPCVTRY